MKMVCTPHIRLGHTLNNETFVDETMLYNSNLDLKIYHLITFVYESMLCLQLTATRITWVRSRTFGLNAIPAMYTFQPRKAFSITMVICYP